MTLQPVDTAVSLKVLLVPVSSAPTPQRSLELLQPRKGSWIAVTSRFVFNPQSIFKSFAPKVFTVTTRMPWSVSILAGIILCWYHLVPTPTFTFCAGGTKFSNDWEVELSLPMSYLLNFHWKTSLLLTCWSNEGPVALHILPFKLSHLTFSIGSLEDGDVKYFGKPSTCCFISLALLLMVPTQIPFFTLQPFLSMQIAGMRQRYTRLLLWVRWFHDFDLATPGGYCKCQEVHCYFQQNLCPLASHVPFFLSEMNPNYVFFSTTSLELIFSLPHLGHISQSCSFAWWRRNEA